MIAGSCTASFCDEEASKTKVKRENRFAFFCPVICPPLDFDALMYSELHCKTNFSFLEGASHADELVRRATVLGYFSLAVTDRNSLAGVVRAHTAAKETGIKLLIGAEITPDDGPPILLWATNRAAYGRLSRLITVGRRRARKGECQTFLADIAEHSEGLIAGVCPSDVTLADSTGPLPASKRVPRPIDTDSGINSWLEPYHHYRDIFADRSFLMLELLRGRNDSLRLQRLRQLSQQTRLPLLAAGDVHYHAAERLVLHDVFQAIRNGTTVDQLDALPNRFANAERHLRTLDEIRCVYTDEPSAVSRTVDIARRCTFSLDELRYEYPQELAPDGATPYAHLTELTWQGARHRYPDGIPDKVRNLLNYELALIKDLHYEAYFLTVWDLVRFARDRGILCQGRGSAANSAVCYCLGITSVDPATMDVLFERFVSRERDEAPDIDVDFEHERREEVLQYLYTKYGRDRAGLAATVITYRTRSAIRDAGKALGLSLDRVDALAKQVEGGYQTTNSHDAERANMVTKRDGPTKARESELSIRCRQVGIDPSSAMGRRLVYCIETMIGFPRHLSQHVGGMVMTRGPLCELVPIENAAMADRTVISWDKTDLEDLGILKVDCLSLGMLTAIRKAFALIKQHTGRDLTLANVPQDDPDVYEMMCRADTMGVFQIESRAQMSMLPRLKPRCYYDLVIEVAIVRPGPIQGQMVHPYLRRRAGDEPVTYATEAIREVLHKTLGVPIFQEQAMRMAVVAAGFTPGEADQLRRAMGAWRRPGIIDTFRHKLVCGMLERGLDASFAEQLFHQIRGFGEYGFPESHAASFALLVYVSAWIKHHHPAIFAAAIINSQPMGFYAPAQLVRNAREHDVEVLPADVNASDWDCTIEAPSRGMPSSTKRDRPQFALRLGLRLIRGFSQRHARQIVAARSDGPFLSQADFAQRTSCSRAVITHLAKADALASLGRDRRQSLWEALAQDETPNQRPLFAGLEPADEAPVTLPQIDDLSSVFADYETVGLSLRAHPIEFYRERLAELHVCSAADLQTLPNDHSVCVAGMVLMRQRPSTAKGITFVTLEDETGVINLVVHQRTWQQYYTVARRCPAWVAFGRLEAKHSVIHVVTQRLVDFAKFTGRDAARLTIKSRDFR